PAVADAIGESEAWSEVAALQLAGRMRKIEDLSAQIEHGALIVHFRRGEIESVSGADVQRQARRDPPVVSQEKFGNVRTFLKNPLLDIDRECADLTQQERRESVAAACDCGTVGSGGCEREGSRWIRRVEHIQRLAADVGAEL